MEQLRVHVERIVRPIRAGVGRKNKMREELLAHLTQKAEGLMAGGGGEAAACAEAIEQLGEPAALRAELQKTVPALERLAYMRLPAVRVFDAWFEKKATETPLRYALVRTFYIALGIGAVLTVMLVVRSLGLLPDSHRRMKPLSYCAVVMTLTYASAILGSFVSYYLADATRLRRILSRETAVSAWLKSGGLCLFMCMNVALMLAPIILFMSMVHPEDVVVLGTVFGGALGRRILLGAALFLLTLFGFCGVAMKFEHKQWARWGSLRIDD